MRAKPPHRRVFMQQRLSASRRIVTICSSVNRVFFMAPSLSEGAILSSVSWPENHPASHHRAASASSPWIALGRHDFFQAVAIGLHGVGLLCGCDQGGVTRRRVPPSAPSADIGQHAAVFNQRRSRGSEEPLGDAETLHGVHAADARTRLQVNRVKLSLCTERVDDAVGNHGNRARTLVEAEIVPIGGRVGVSPPSGTGPRIERLHDILIPNAVKQDDGQRDR